MNERCFGWHPRKEECACLIETMPGCGTPECPFYKPESKKDWERVEKDGKVTFRKINY